MAEKNKAHKQAGRNKGVATVANTNQTTLSEDELLFRQGLYSAYASSNLEPAFANDKAVSSAAATGNTAGAGTNAPGLLRIAKLADYIPAALLFWALAYVLVAFGIMPLAHSPLLGIASIFTAFSVLTVILLFRSQPSLGPWPANRAAAFMLSILLLDFWVWVFNRPYEGISSYIYLGIDIFAFTALSFGIYMFIYKRLHIEAVVKLFMVKAFFDFAAYVLSGGFGIALLNRIGINHPLHIDAIFTVAMLELWVLLLYILKYRNKITRLPE